MVKSWSSGEDEQQYQRRLRATVGIVRAESCGRDKQRRELRAARATAATKNGAQANSPPLMFHGKARSTVQPTGATFHSYGSGEGGRFRGGNSPSKWRRCRCVPSATGDKNGKSAGGQNRLGGGRWDLNWDWELGVQKKKKKRERGREDGRREE